MEQRFTWLQSVYNWHSRTVQSVQSARNRSSRSHRDWTLTGFYVNHNPTDFELPIISFGHFVWMYLRLCQLIFFPFLLPEKIYVLDNFAIFQRVIFFDFIVELWEFSDSKFVGLLSESKGLHNDSTFHPTWTLINKSTRLDISNF